jgi:hypothetical protein
MATKQKPPHHRGSYDRRSRQVVAAAKADPTTTCWRCGKTLTQHPFTRTGNPPKWSAGHVIDSDPQSPLLPEVLSCNARAGQLISARKRRKYRPQPPLVSHTTTDW